MFNKLKIPPSKFGRGISLLWRGMNLDLINSFSRQLYMGQSSNFKLHPVPKYYFESARSSIFSFLLAVGIKSGDEIIVSAFTCAAVTQSIIQAGAVPVYVDINDDLSMNDISVLKNISSKTKSVILQNTFGRLGLKKKTINSLKTKKIWIIEDCALAIGSKNNGNKLGSFGDVAIWSYEVSKSITVGWGGVLLVNNSSLIGPVENFLRNIREVFILEDLRRLIQLWLSVILVNKFYKFGWIFWYLMYGFRLFRRSNNLTKDAKSKKLKLGKYTKKFLKFISPEFDTYYCLTNMNYILLQKHAQSLGLECPVIQKHYEKIVSPRFPILIDERYIKKIVELGINYGIEVGRWYDEAPPKWCQEKCINVGVPNAIRVSRKIINLPCHWTLTSDEVDKLIYFLSVIKESTCHSLLDKSLMVR